MLGNQVDHLTPNHTGRTGGGGEFRDELAPHRRIAMRVGVGQHPEGRGQQTVSSENRRRLVELFVARRAAAAQIAIVHRGQVVMNEGIGMDHLDRRGRSQQFLRVRTEGLPDRHH